MSALEVRAKGAGRDWRLEERAGLLLAICSPLQAIPGVGHAFSTRVADGRVDFDLGGAGSVSETLRERRRRLVAAAGLGEATPPAVLRQQHGSKVVRSSDASDEPEGDAALWSHADGEAPPPAVRTADCVPILIAHKGARAAAAVHAGWRGTASGIAGVAVRELGRAGIGPRELVAALGPAILGCCYEVDDAVLARVTAASGGESALVAPGNRADRVHLDLHAANRRQLVQCGLDPTDIHLAPWCTRCRGDLLFSYRRDGEAAGRHMAVVGPRVVPDRLTVRPR